MKSVPVSFGTLLACILLAAPSLAGGKPSFDCAKADNDATKAVCASDALAELDRELARLYHLAVSGQYMTPEREKELKATQRGWIKGRDECWKSDLGLETCIANEYAFRIHELREGYADARRDDGAGASLGPLAIVCKGFDAGISAVFVNTADPMVSLKWNDSSIVLPRVGSASGAKYESDTWGGVSSFWTQGKEALFTPPGGTELTCVVEEIG